MKRPVRLSRRAFADLLELQDYISASDGEERAAAYITRIRTKVDSIGVAPERGTLREKILPGLRTIGFERRITIAFVPEAHQVTVVRVLYGGRSIEKAFKGRR